MLENKRAIVTGGSRGIGRAIVKYLAEKNCSKILLSDIAFEGDPEECAKEIKSDIKNTTVEIFAFKADASSFEDAQATVDEAVNKMGGVDILVNNAGITRDNLLLRMSEKEFDDVIAINLKSVFNYTKAAIRPIIFLSLNNTHRTISLPSALKAPFFFGVNTSLTSWSMGRIYNGSLAYSFTGNIIHSSSCCLLCTSIISIYPCFC